MPLPNAPDYSQRIYELLKETDLENLSYAQFQSVAEKIFIEPENEDEMRRLVLVQLARMAVRGDWDGFLSGGGGGGGAPTNAEYVVMSLNGTLTDERVLAAGTGISLTDGGAGSNATIANTGVTSNVPGTGISVSSATGASTITNTGVTSNVAGTGISVSSATGASTITNTGVTSLVAGTNITLSPGSGVGDVTVTAATPTGLAPNDASYLTLGLDGDLTNERVLTAGTGISFTDTGPNGTLTVEATGGGGGGGGSGFIQPPTASGAISASYNKYPIFASAPYGTGDTGSFSSTAFNQYPCMRPFVLGEGGTWGGVAIYVDTASASNSVLISLYESDSDGMPAAFIGYCDISTDATGSVTQTTTLDSGGSSASFTLDKDTQYWCSFVMKENNDGTTLRMINIDGLATLGNSNMSNAGTILRNTNVSNAIETTNPPRNNQIIGNGTAPHIGLIM
jgi:hypothetical protein